jgi:hypothetical protein
VCVCVCTSISLFRSLRVCVCVYNFFEAAAPSSLPRFCFLDSTGKNFLVYANFFFSSAGVDSTELKTLLKSQFKKTLDTFRVAVLTKRGGGDI